MPMPQHSRIKIYPGEDVTIELCRKDQNGFMLPVGNVTVSISEDEKVEIYHSKFGLTFFSQLP